MAGLQPQFEMCNKPAAGHASHCRKMPLLSSLLRLHHTFSPGPLTESQSATQASIWLPFCFSSTSLLGASGLCVCVCVYLVLSADKLPALSVYVIGAYESLSLQTHSEIVSQVESAVLLPELKLLIAAAVTGIF